MRKKLDLIYSTYHYFLANQDLISKENIKKHISDRVDNPKVFEKIDKELTNDYINSYLDDNNDFDFTTIDEKEIEELNIEELLGKNKLKK